MGTVERWRWIRGFPDYQVSDYGRIRSFRNSKYHYTSNNGRILSPVTTKELPSARITLYNDYQQKVQRTVSHLVLEAFGEERPSPEWCAVCIDGNNSNLHISNLKWEHRKVASDPYRKVRIR